MFLFSNPLKAIWKALQQPHDWLYPAPEVMEKLESKGYRFQFNDRAYGRIIIKTYDVITPDGKKATDICEADPKATERYKRDYSKAVEECRNNTFYF